MTTKLLFINDKVFFKQQFENKYEANCMSRSAYKIPTYIGILNCFPVYKAYISSEMIVIPLRPKKACLTIIAH